MNKIDAPRVREVLDAVVAERPDHVDRRPSGDLPPRYVEHGEPACLVAVVMHRLGASTGVLKALDHEGGVAGGGVRLDETRHPLRRRYTEIAWDLLAFLQRRNDRGDTWSEARRQAFLGDPYWLATNPQFAYPGPWCTSENMIDTGY